MILIIPDCISIVGHIAYFVCDLLTQISVGVIYSHSLVLVRSIHTV